MHYKLSNIPLLLCSLLCANSLMGAQTGDDDVLSSLSKDMERYAHVATVTKQNEHYQPYIISVFLGKDLEKLGVLNLKEALGLVPGVDMATDNVNTQTPIFRGSNPLASGQSKLFIDGVLMNNVFFDAYSEYLSFPIEMIKRIEVVRGPGSKTDGFNAYAGSINVVTYAENFDGFHSNDKLVVKAGSNQYMMGGFVKSYQAEKLKVFIDFFYQEDNKKVPSGPDGYSQGSMSIPGVFDNTGLSQNGDVPVWLKDYSLGVQLNYDDFYIKARTLNHTQGSAYGINLSLPQNKDRVKLPSNFIEVGYNKEISNLKIDLKAGVRYDAFDSKAKLAPDGLFFMDMVQYSSGGGITPVSYPDGIYGEHLASQRTLYQSSYLKYKGIENHLFIAGYRLIKEETIDMISKLSNWSTGDADLVDYTEIYPFFDKNAKRDIYIFSLQDEYQFNDSLSLVYGFNYEQTSYKDAGLEPRVSMVYQNDRENIFKASYSKSHRNASWQEMFTMNNHSRQGSHDLNPEKVDAFEAAYIRQFSNDVYLQTNLFYLLNKDQIYNSSVNPVYSNVLDTNIYGLELEYKGRISFVDQIYFNYAYVTGESRMDNKNIPLTNVSHHLAKAYYIYNFNTQFALSGIAKYVGSKDRVSDDTRENVEAYSTLDTTLKYKNIKYNFDVKLSVKNIFDADVKYPSPPKTYTEDYAQERRSFLVTITKEF